MQVWKGELMHVQDGELEQMQGSEEVVTDEKWQVSAGAGGKYSAGRSYIGSIGFGG